LITSSLSQHEKSIGSVVSVMRLELVTLLMLWTIVVVVVVVEAFVIETRLDVGFLWLRRSRVLWHGERGVVNLARSASVHSSAVKVQSTWGSAARLERAENGLRVWTWLREHGPTTTRGEASSKRRLVGSRKTTSKVVVVAEVVVVGWAGEHSRTERA